MGRKVHVLESCESTNDFAMNLARDGCEDGTVVIAKHQTMGKGRAGRTFESWPGNLALSIILRPKIGIASSHQLVMASALATVAALESVGVSALIKWPNDILIEGPGTHVAKLGPYRKIGGILLELATTGQKIDAAVIGIGLNLVRPPKEKADRIIPQMGFIEDLNRELELQSLTSAILDALEKYLYSNILAQVKERSAILGKKVTVDLGDKSISGIAADLADDGSLIVQTADGSLERIFYGDLSLTDA